MNIDQALNILKSASCTEIKIPATETESDELRQALLLITELCDYEILGICADNLEQALNSLHQYLTAMGYNISELDCNNKEYSEGVYLKYNTQKRSTYIDSYMGKYRGVLISCQTSNQALMGTYGHLPLNLFS
jgi:hypothetical protein